MKVTLNGTWGYQKPNDNEGLKEKWFEISNIKNYYKKKQVEIPKCWNYIEENGKVPFHEYEGVMWFFKVFEFDAIKKDEDVYLYFNGSNYLTQVWLNEKLLGENEGGFLPFKFKINNYLKSKDNFIAVRIENYRKTDRIPCEGFDWYNYGGIYREVFIEKLNKVRFKSIKIKTEKILKGKALISIKFEQTEAFNFGWEIFFKNTSVLKGNHAKGEKAGNIKIIIKSPKLWDVNTPDLYVLKTINESSGGKQETIFGVRKIEIVNGKIYLNKKLMQLKGVSLHEEQVPYGRAIPLEDRKNDIMNMKKFGFNALRSSHYSHDESLMKFADELGILILEEIPIYWMIEFSNPKILKLGLKMINTLIERDYNHPSVIMWSLANEIPVENKYCQHVMKALYKFAKKKDDSRIVTHVTARLFGDPLRKFSDVACVNMYFGWYLLSEKNINFILELIRPTATDKPFFITEFGAGAKFGVHSNDFMKFSEEKQASILSHSIKTFNSKEWIQGHFIWIYRDFKSPLRTNQYQKGFNRKGVVSEINEPKLMARVYNSIKNQKLKTRKFRILSKIGSFIMNWLERYLMDVLISKIMKKISTSQSDKYYQDTKK